MTAARIRQQLQEIRERADPKRPVFAKGVTDNGELYGIEARGELYLRDQGETDEAFRRRVRAESEARPLVIFTKE